MPLMSSSPPLELHIDHEATPFVVHKVPSIPEHWVEKMKQDLDKDVQLGVLEKVPSNTPTMWCAHMSVVDKKTGKPRRVFDFPGLNKDMAQQTQSFKSPFMQASWVPAGTWNMSVDAWKGYHSVSLRECDRHYTTFIMPCRRYRYC